jgi:hypothetical protein
MVKKKEIVDKIPIECLLKFEIFSLLAAMLSPKDDGMVKKIVTILMVIGPMPIDFKNKYAIAGRTTIFDATLISIALSIGDGASLQIDAPVIISIKGKIMETIISAAFSRESGKLRFKFENNKPKMPPMIIGLRAICFN